MRRLLVAGIALLTLASPVRAAEDGPALPIALGTYAVLNGIDLSETMYLLGSKGGVEANPFFSPLSNRPVAFGALKTGLVIGAIYGAVKIHKHHPKVAWILTSVGIALESYAVVHNARLLHR